LLLGAEHAEPDNMHTPAAVIQAPTQRAESAFGVPLPRKTMPVRSSSQSLEYADNYAGE
jgi:hypothetical protein